MLKLSFSSLALLAFSTLIASHDMACAMEPEGMPLVGHSTQVVPKRFQPTLGMSGPVGPKTRFQPMDAIREVPEEVQVKKTLPTERKTKSSSKDKQKTRKPKVKKTEADPK